MRAGISEIFYSLQLEGALIGYPAVFVRFAGCNLSCEFCDTKYALTEGKEMNPDEVFNEVNRYSAKRIIFTGGEPALYDNFMYDFMNEHPEYGYFIETNGTIPLTLSIGYFEHVVVSPKLHAIEENVLTYFKENARSVEFKFIVKTEKDIEDSLMLSEKLKLYPVTLQPMHIEDEPISSYIERTKKLIEVFKNTPLAKRDARLIMQNQKILYPGQRGV